MDPEATAAIQSLLERAQEGDRKAFERLVEACQGRGAAMVRAHLGERLGRRLEVEDILQETFLSAWRALGGFRMRNTADDHPREAHRDDL